MKLEPLVEKLRYLKEKAVDLASTGYENYRAAVEGYMRRGGFIPQLSAERIFGEVPSIRKCEYPSGRTYVQVGPNTAALFQSIIDAEKNGVRTIVLDGPKYHFAVSVQESARNAGIRAVITEMEFQPAS